MNLFTNPSIQELNQLLSQCDTSASNHNLVVDFDGEVLIDPELQLPEIDLDKFKFRVRLQASSKDFLNRGSTWMRNLLNNLVYCWENNTRFPNMAMN
ncbi:MAG: hypothetical protein ABI855_19610 [Bacteroidota bacterium]